MNGWIEFEVMLFKTYINYVEQFFLSKEQEIEEKFNELLKTPDDDPIREDIQDYHQSYYQVLEDNLIDENFHNTEFTKRFRFAVIIQLYSLMEKHLNRILPYYIKQNSIDKLKLKGNLLTKAKTILKPQLNLAALSEYDFLQSFSELRNTIVHSAGIFYEKNTKTLNTLNTLTDKYDIKLKITEGFESKIYEVQIESDTFLHEALNQIGAMLEKVYFQLNNYSKQLGNN